MKALRLLGCILILYTLSSFSDNKACDFAGSNIGYIKTQTFKAIASEDVNSAHYFAYKALNAIEKSQKQLAECGCKYALKNISESQENLKLATRIKSLNGSRILLRRALENASGSLEALNEHDALHGSPYESDILALNTLEVSPGGNKQPEGAALRKKIDESLLNFQNSLDKVVRTVECRDAYSFASNIYRNCEEQLLKPDLTEAKKYYNLRTKEITEVALEKLRRCAK